MDARPDMALMPDSMVENCQDFFYQFIVINRDFNGLSTNYRLEGFAGQT